MHFDSGCRSDLRTCGGIVECDAVLGNCVAEDQAGFVGAGASDNDVVVADGDGPVEVVCAGAEFDCSAASCSNGVAGLGEGFGVVFVVVCSCAESFDSCDGLDVRDAALNARLGPVRIDDAVGSDDVRGSEFCLLMGPDLILGPPGDRGSARGDEGLGSGP